MKSKRTASYALLILLSLLANSACTHTYSYALTRSEFEGFSKGSDAPPELKSKRSNDIPVDEDSRISVNIESNTRVVVPFAFVVKGDLVTPIPALLQKESLRDEERVLDLSPFEITGESHYEVESTVASKYKTWLLFLGLAGGAATAYLYYTNLEWDNMQMMYPN